MSDRQRWRRIALAGTSLSKQLLAALAVMSGAVYVCASQTKSVADNSCKGIDAEQARYLVRSSRIIDPFDFLPWVRKREHDAAERIASLVNGKPFLYSTARDQALKIIEDENFLPDTTEARIKLRLEFVNISNCSNQSLDLTYRVYSTQIMPVLSGAPEARSAEDRAPQRAAGLVDVKLHETRPVYFTPLAGYDSTDKLFGGAELRIKPRSASSEVLDSVVIDAQASSTMRDFSAAAAGAKDSSGWLAHAEWRFDYRYYSLPTGAGKLKSGSVAARFSGTSQPFANGNVVFRFGTSLEGGNRQSDLPAANLASDTISNAAFGGLKVFAGIAARFRHHVFSGSYGLELGSTRRSLRFDWSKQLADLRHEYWRSVGDHRTLEIESRLTLGKLTVRNKVPEAERFFGGNSEEFFVTDDSWQIRAGPFIRAIPARKFYRTRETARKTFLVTILPWRTLSGESRSYPLSCQKTKSSKACSKLNSSMPHHLNNFTFLPRILIT